MTVRAAICVGSTPNTLASVPLGLDGVDGEARGVVHMLLEIPKVYRRKELIQENRNMPLRGWGSMGSGATDQCLEGNHRPVQPQTMSLSWESKHSLASLLISSRFQACASLKVESGLHIAHTVE